MVCNCGEVKFTNPTVVQFQQRGVKFTDPTAVQFQQRGLQMWGCSCGAVQPWGMQLMEGAAVRCTVVRFPLDQSLPPSLNISNEKGEYLPPSLKISKGEGVNIHPGLVILVRERM